jgi:DNA-binding CsgD family transcriptional regulator/tetratricopeptide (TPR) repeat protein
MDVERARALCREGAWQAAYDALAGATDLEPLTLLSTCCYMLGRDDEYAATLERTHQLQLDAGDTLAAARTAFWLVMHLFLAGQVGQATGWLARGERLVGDADCVERGYLLMPAAFRLRGAGDLEGGAALAAEAAATGLRFGDNDLFALATHARGHFLVRAGRVVEGLELLDEAMVAVTAGELGPITSGVVYCGVIMGCQAAFEPRRAAEWTAALARWCERQPDMVAFNGRCRVHRAEIMQLRGEWSEALEEAEHAVRFAATTRGEAIGEAAYVQGEVHRLRGDLAAAEEAYRKASGHGREPYPGLALLRLEQGRIDVALTAIRRVLGATTLVADRARLLPAYAEIQLAAGDVEGAREACADLAQLASSYEVGVLGAVLAQTEGAVLLAAGDPSGALVVLRHAWRVWDEVQAPYEAARVRALMSAACRALGDEDAAALERDAARQAFIELGAARDLARLDCVDVSHGLTARELEVLRLITAGHTNKAIAAELVLSERTVDRHVSNIFVKLAVSSRAAATAYAYENQLV